MNLAKEISESNKKSKVMRDSSNLSEGTHMKFHSLSSHPDFMIKNLNDNIRKDTLIEKTDILNSIPHEEHATPFQMSEEFIPGNLD